MLKIDKLPPKILTYRHDTKDGLVRQQNLFDSPRIVGIEPGGLVIEADHEGIVYRSMVDSHAFYFWIAVNESRGKKRWDIGELGQIRFQNLEWSPVKKKVKL